MLRLTWMSRMSKCQEREPQAGTFLFIEPQDSESRWELARWRPVALGHPRVLVQT
jgi:hypothetical protein